MEIQELDSPTLAVEDHPDVPAVTESTHFVARCDDDFILEYPKDLYIPPDALHLLLEKFEGPFDLLLYLIRKKSLDILDVSVAEVTQQYVCYVNCLFETRSHLSVEYLLMAALLIHLKTRMLLPKPVESASEGEQEDPRALLVRRLEEYERIKFLANQISEMPVVGRDVFAPVVSFEERELPLISLPQVTPKDLARVWKKLSERHQRLDPYWLRAQHLSVREHMTAILGFLHEHFSCLLTQLLIDTPEPSFLVVYFIAALQLSRDQLVFLDQKNNTDILLSLPQKIENNKV